MSLTPTQRLAALMDAEAAGQEIEILAFDGRKPTGVDPVGPECLSPWYWQPFTVDGVEYPTTGHYAMAEKARLFGDAEALAAVLAARSVRAAQTAGRRIRGVDRALWYEVGFGVLVNGNVARFCQNSMVCEYVLKTGQRVPVKASPHSRVWGVGLGVDDPDLEHPSRWIGLNLYGFSIEVARELLIDGVELW